MRLFRFFGLAKGRFGRGLILNITSTFFTQGSTFLTSIVLARLLGVEVYGEYGMILSTLLTVSSIAQVSTGLTVTKYIAELRDVDKERAGRILGLCSTLTLLTGIVATILLLLFAPWVSGRIMAAPHLELSLVFSAPFVLFSVMNAYQIGGLAGLESYKSITIYSAILGILFLLICSIGSFFGGLNGALFGVVICATLRWLVYALILRSEAKKHQIFLQRSRLAEERNILLKFTLPAAMAGLSSMPAIWLSNAFLVQQPGGYSEMGIYVAALNLKTLFLLLPSLINGVATSIINSHKGHGAKKSYNSAFSLTLRVTIVTSILGAMCMFFGGQFLINNIFGKDYLYQNTKLLISIMAMQVVIEATGIAVYQLIQAQEEMWKSFFYIALPRDIMIIILSYIFVPIYGAIGLASSMLISFFFALIVKSGIAYSLKGNIQD